MPDAGDFKNLEIAKDQLLDHLRIQSDRGKNAVFEFRENLRRATGLTRAQLSRFENGNQPLKTRQGQYIHDVILGYLKEQRLSEPTQISRASRPRPPLVERIKIDFIRDLQIAWEKNFSSMGLLRLAQKQGRRIEDIEELHRALLHFTMDKFRGEARLETEQNDLLKRHLGGYRIIAPYSSKMQMQEIVVSGLFLEMSPYADLIVFQEIFQTKSKANVRYRGFCFSDGTRENISHYLLGFSEGRIQLTILNVEIGRTSSSEYSQSKTAHERPVWLTGLRLMYDSSIGPITTRIVGRYLDPSTNCYVGRGIRAVDEYSSDISEEKQTELLQRLGPLSATETD
jgi:hypothetical protein